MIVFPRARSATKNHLTTPRKVKDVKCAPSCGKGLEVSDRFKDRFRRPHKPVRDARPKRYSRTFKSGDWEQGQEAWCPLDDYLKNKPPDAVVTNVKLKVVGTGYVIIQGNDSPLSRGQKSRHPHFHVVGNFES